MVKHKGVHKQGGLHMGLRGLITVLYKAYDSGSICVTPGLMCRRRSIGESNVSIFSI